MIPASALVPFDATRRYDENGDPLYSPAERILLALRFFDWVTVDSLRVALDVEPRNNRYSAAMYRLVKIGRVLRRVELGLVEYKLADIQPTLHRKPEREYDADGNAVRRSKIGRSKTEYTRSRRGARKKAGLCIYCGVPAGGKASCQTCRDKARAYYKARHPKDPGPEIIHRCTRCRAEASPGKTMCERHLEEMRLKRKKQYAARKQSKVCDSCRQPSDTVICAECKESRSMRRAA